MSISVSERSEPKPPSSVRDGAEARKKRQREAADVLRERKDNPVERRVRVAQSRITFSKVSPATLRECTECGRENWRWLTECPGCGTPVDV